MNPKIISTLQIKKLFKIENEISIEEFVKNNNIVYVKRKRTGEERFIYSPSDHLKAIQKWIVHNLLGQVEYSEYSHAYCKNKSIFTNATSHIGCNILLKLDIHNFFDSISINKVEKIFLDLGYNMNVSHSLSLFCTYLGYVRQGFVTSPIISNIIMLNFDKNVTSLIEERYEELSLIYTRYADDITISSSKKGNKLTFRKICKDVIDCLLDEGFKENPVKTKIIKGSGPKIVTGVLVKEKSISVPSKFRRYLLKEIYYCKKYGVKSHLIYTNNLGKINYIEYLLGIANYIHNTDQKFAEKIKKEIRTIDINS
jgi:hypothetical protein